ncbi:MAG: hypothetical protein ACO2ZM_02315 [Francisellaceae bacterium]
MKAWPDRALRQYCRIFTLIIIVMGFFQLSYASLILTPENEDGQSVVSEITVKQVIDVQNQWAAGIVAIGKAYMNKADYKKLASQLIDELYAYNYENGVVLFKPTKAKEQPFRKTKASALSYFIGQNETFPEDKGFATHPWIKVVFHNSEMYFHGDMAIAMGIYDFTDTQGKITSVEYTFGYISDGDGRLKIVLHHSSMPFNAEII